MTRIFYSHAKKTYGTVAEAKQLSIIRERFPAAEVVDPGSGEDAPGKPEKGIEYFLSVVDGCDALVFSRHNGVVTSGVLEEVKRALSKGKPVYEIRKAGRVVRVSRAPARSSKLDAASFVLSESLGGLVGKTSD